MVINDLIEQIIADKSGPPNKIRITKEQINKIIELVDLGYGSRAIAKELDIGRIVIIRILKELNIVIPKNVSRVAKLLHKKCNVCLQVKPISEFYKSVKTN